MLHPQIATLYQLLKEHQIPPVKTLTPVDARKWYLERQRITSPAAAEVAEVKDIHADTPTGKHPLRVYRPIGSQAQEQLPVLIYYHGGGGVIGDLDSHDALCRDLCNGSGCAVIAVHYRLGPEAPFPAGVDDAIAVAYWVYANAKTFNLDAQRLAVGGDSAGGNLAAVVALAARDAGDLPIKFQLLIYPVTDMRRIAPSHSRNGQGYLLTTESINYFHTHYIVDSAWDTDWRASPLLHPRLDNLPPAFVLTAGYDPLCDEGLQYAQALSEAGNKASLICFERQIHGFITMGGIIDEANVAVDLCAAQVRLALK
jgi:acetyl esterase